MASILHGLRLRMTVLLFVLSALILLVTLVDAFVTIFSTQGSGPLTAFWTQRVWLGLMALHRRRPMHRFLVYWGPVTVLSSVVGWYVLLVLGWSLAFIAHPDSVVSSSTLAPVHGLRKLYFVGTTTSSTGYGDLVPEGPPWTMFSSLAAFSATVVVTISLSYVLSVLNAAVERKTLARTVFGLGDTLEEFHAAAFAQGNVLDSHLCSLAHQVNRHAHQHLAYPVLHYFHSERLDASPARAALLLGDAVFLERHAPDSSSPLKPGLLKLLETSLETYQHHALRGVLHRIPHVDRAGEAELRRLALARSSSESPVTAEQVEHALAEYAPRRSQLLAICAADGWPVS